MYGALSLLNRSMSYRNLQAYTSHTLIEKDHLGDWSPEKDCCY